MPYHIAPAIIIDGTLYTLLVFSLATWTLILFKIWQFAKNNYYNRRFSNVFWDAPSLSAAGELPGSKARGPQARIAKHGFSWLNDMSRSQGKLLKYCGTPQELLEQALRLQTQKEQRSMESGLTLLASIGSTAPFVGLFGTVMGIMHALHDISRLGSASLDVVAGPIGDALIATAIGIAVAVPAVLAYNFFLRRAKHHRIALENFVDGFVHVAFNSNRQRDNQYGI
ncbi:MAG: MotA/TolQ/ExbB proton channel family protein [Gammaproteobacteria bacterium]